MQMGSTMGTVVCQMLSVVLMRRVAALQDTLVPNHPQVPLYVLKAPHQTIHFVSLISSQSVIKTFQSTSSFANKTFWSANLLRKAKNYIPSFNYLKWG